MKASSKIEARLTVTGVALQEYGGEAENSAIHGASLTKYVEAVAGSVFAVQLTVPPGLASYTQYGLCCNVYLDGKYATGRVVTPERFARTPYILVIEGVDGMSSRGRELERFAFAQLKTNDNSLTANTKPEEFKDLGNVTVDCIWCRQIGTNYVAFQDSFKPAVDTSIPEKCLKGRAISNQASVAKAEPMAGSVMTVQISYPYGMKPFASFKFKYRSRTDLQIEGIIEKDPEPVALEDRDPATLTAEEVGQLQQQLQAKRESMLKIKKEKRAWVHEDDGEDDDAVIVSDGPSTKKRKSTDSGVQMIDLTDD